MTKNRNGYLKSLFILSALCTLSLSANAQIGLTATAGTLSQSYTTLGAAFTAINAGTHQGVITINLTGNTNEGSTAATLNASGTGSASYTAITIKPSGGAARSITGNVAGNLITLDGADNVVINGLNTAGNSLSINNTNVNLVAGTIRFINDACSNKVTNCTITGASTATNTGTIVFSTGTTTGNDNDTISNNTIDWSASNLQDNAIYSGGTATAGIENSGIVISGNNIANYFRSSVSTSAGIMINTGSTDWIIENNRFYQSTTLVPGFTNITHYAILAKTGSGYAITGNIIGYATSAGTGTYTISSAFNTPFYPISLAVGTASPTSVQGNIITAINLSTANNSSTGGGMFSGIYVTSGDVNIGTTSGNTIGTASGTGAITVTTAGSNGAIMGIASSTTGTLVIQNNTIGSMSSLGTTAVINTGLHGIFINTAPASLTISDNTIGNATADNMVAGTLGVTTVNSLVSGMNIAANPPTTTVSGNTVQGLTSYGTGLGGYARGIWTAAATGSAATYKVKNNTVKNITGYSSLASVTSGQAAAVGINIAIGTADTISGNTVFNIKAANTGTGNYIASGIALANATNTVACNNIIYGISNEGTGTTATAPPAIAGITIRSGTTNVTLYNNMISLGSGITTNTAIIGIWGNYGSTPNPVTNIFNNTVNIEGTASSGSLSSFCFHRGDFSINRLITVDVRNNIFTNSRSGGTGTHYAIGNNFGFTANAAGWGVNASDYNVLNANAATVGYWSADKTFADWQTASASDGNSYSGITVTYVNSANNLHLNMGTTATDIESGGAPIGIVTTDIDGHVRPGPAGSVNNGAMAPDLGADEIDGVPTFVRWSGTTNNDWNTNTNWVGNAVPATTARALIPSGLTNYPVITTGTAAIRRIIINSGGSLTLSGGTLQLTGSIINNGTFTANAGGTLELNGAVAQTIAANTFAGNTIANLKLNNTIGISLGGTLNVTGAVTPTSGVLTTNGYLVLKSSATGTGYIAAGSTGGGYISGNVTVERYIPGKRAFRFLAHPFNASIALSQLTDDIDITGSGGTTNGFTATSTNSPSSFWYDLTTGDNSTTGTNPGWTAFTHTNGAGVNAWARYGGARILVRGAKGEGLNSAPYTPSEVTIGMSGALNQGNTTVNLTKGTNTDYVFVGNPFPSAVNMDAISGTNTGSAFYIWDATQGTRGGYTSYSFGSSSFNLPSCGSFFTTLSANGSVTFEEADKVSTGASIFKTTAAANTVQLRIEDSTIFWDRLLVRFDGNANAMVDYPDARKFTNSEINFFSFSKDDSMLSIDARPYADGEVIKLGLYATLQKNFKIVASEFDMPAGTKIFLHDKFLNKVEEVTGAGYEYWFAVTADPASTGNGRFELRTQGQQANNIAAVTEKHGQITLLPNPAKEYVTIHYEGMNNGNITVTIKDIKGATIAQKQHASNRNGDIQLSLQALPAGVYMVSIQNGNERIVQKLVKE